MVLTDEKSIKILQTIAKEPLNFTEVFLIVGGSPQAISDRLKKLEAGGYLHSEKSSTFPFSRTIHIEKKGMDFLILGGNLP